MKMPINKYTDKQIEKLIEIAYQANNQARRMVNKYEPDNQSAYNFINDRAKYLSENFADKNQPKIIQSNEQM